MAVTPAEVAANHSGLFVFGEASKNARPLVVGSRGRGGSTGLVLASVSPPCSHHAMGVVLVTQVTPRRPTSER